MKLPEVAFEAFRDLPATYPYGVRWAPTLSQVGQVAVGLGDRDVARAVYDKLLPSAPYYAGDGSGAVFSTGACSRLLGDRPRQPGCSTRPSITTRGRWP